MSQATIKNNNNKPPQPPLIFFPDILDDYKDDVSAAFFELANASRIAYRLPSNVVRKAISPNKQQQTSTSQQSCIVIHQDESACLQHTGGIVWETCYLLLTYLTTATHDSILPPLGNVLEVGAGCGLLGQGLAKCATRVVLTEHPEAFDNLQANVLRHADTLLDKAPSAKVDCCVLDWLHVDRDVATNTRLLNNGPFDTIVGTDVYFSPRLVGPLLETMQKLSHANTIVYLCVQIRCAVSHRLLLDKAGDYEFDVTNVSEQVCSVKGCEWGSDMECIVLLLTRTK